MTIATVSPSKAVRYGPTAVPELTLGWAILGWTAEYLLQPDGPEAGKPWRFTDEQALFVLNWYAIDKYGRWVYRRGMLRRMKGWGKDPVGAVLCAVEFVGPCRFGGFDKAGQPIAESHPAAWVQTAAVSRDQTRNTMTLFPGLFSPRAIEEYSIDLGKEIIYAHHGRCRIEAVTSSPRSLEGGRSTFVLKNETHHWLRNNDGHEMSAVIARNLAKSRDGSARSLAISNAHSMGEDSDAEHDWEASRATPGDILYDSLEAPADVDFDDDAALRDALISTRGDSEWLDVDRLLAEIRDPNTSRSMAVRYYLNQIGTADDRAFDQVRFELLKAPRVVEPGALITLGFDGSVNRDHTALIGTEVATGYQWVVGYWEPRLDDSGEVRIPVQEVDATVAAAFDRWSVWRINADPFYWQEWVSTWAGRYDKPGQPVVVSWNTTQYRRMAFALLAYKHAIDAGDLTHDGDGRFVAAIGNAYRHLQNFVDDNGDRMWTIEKERPDSPLKIDAAMAACLSWEARMAAVAAGAKPPAPSVYESRGLRTL